MLKLDKIPYVPFSLTLARRWEGTKYFPSRLGRRARVRGFNADPIVYAILQAANIAAKKKQIGGVYEST